MTTDPESRRRGESLLRELFAELPSDLGITEARMFNGPGLRVAAGFFGFVDHLGGLIVKLPTTEVGSMITAGEGEPVTMGTRTMREWVRIQYPDDDDAERWRIPLLAARGFVAGGARPHP